MRLPPPGPTQVHVWTASLPSVETTASDPCAELAPDERARAARFRTPGLQRRFAAARVALRRLLAAYLAVDPATLAIGCRVNGKPYLLDAPDLCFNVSHAGDAAIYAIASAREVGIDIEATARDVDIAGVARQAFSPLECAALTALEPGRRREAFFRIWTRKEAYVKARGEGMRYPTRAFSVSPDADADALLGDERDDRARARWRVVGLAAPPGFAAALSAEGRDWSVLQFDAARLVSDAASRTRNGAAPA